MQSSVINEKRTFSGPCPWGKSVEVRVSIASVKRKMPGLVEFWVLCGLEDGWSFRQYLMGQNKSQKQALRNQNRNDADWTVCLFSCKMYCLLLWSPPSTQGEMQCGGQECPMVRSSLCCPTNQHPLADDKYLIQEESSSPYCCYRYQGATRLARIPTSNSQKVRINNEPNTKTFTASPQGERRQPRLDMAAPLSQKELGSYFLLSYFPRILLHSGFWSYSYCVHIPGSRRGKNG